MYGTAILRSILYIITPIYLRTTFIVVYKSLYPPNILQPANFKRMRSNVFTSVGYERPKQFDHATYCVVVVNRVVVQILLVMVTVRCI